MPAPLPSFPPPGIEHLGTPVAWADAHGVLLGCNGAFAHWLETGARRLAGVSLAQLDAEAPRLAELLARLPQGSDEAVAARGIRLQLPSGNERRADLWLTRMATGLLIEAHPLDDLHHSALDQRLPDALSAALKGLAHEVRNPLAGLRGAAQLLARRSPDADARRYVEVILHECDRLAALVDRLLNPASAKAFVPTNVHQVLERVRLLAEAEVRTEGALRLLRDYDPSLPELDADPDRLTQALWNLLRNAMEAGAQQVHLRTRAERNVLIGERVHRLALRVEVEDDGRGVPDDLAERIFLPLVSSRFEGSGLGLTLAQQVAREHGGLLSYRSRPGHTQFTLLLPVN